MRRCVCALELVMRSLPTPPLPCCLSSMTTISTIDACLRYLCRVSLLITVNSDRRSMLGQGMPRPARHHPPAEPHSSIIHRHSCFNGKIIKSKLHSINRSLLLNLLFFVGAMSLGDVTAVAKSNWNRFRYYLGLISIDIKEFRN